MTLLIIRMNVLSEKSKELSQTISSLSLSTRIRRDVSVVTSVRVSRMKTDSFFLKNGIPRKILKIT